MWTKATQRPDRRGLLNITNQIKANWRTKYDHIGEWSHCLPRLSLFICWLGEPLATSPSSRPSKQVTPMIQEVSLWWHQPLLGHAGPLSHALDFHSLMLQVHGSGVTQQGWDFAPLLERGLVFSGQMFLLHPLANPGVWSHTFQPFVTQFKPLCFLVRTKMRIYLCICGFTFFPLNFIMNVATWTEMLKAPIHQSLRFYHSHIAYLHYYIFIHWPSHQSIHQSVSLILLYQIKGKLQTSEHFPLNTSAFLLLSKVQYCLHFKKCNKMYKSQVYN